MQPKPIKEMKSFSASLQAQRLPRYTSYPPATEFSELAPETHQRWLKALDSKQAVSLYMHIPFCRQLCWFCGCFTSITQHYDPISRYVELLIQEIHWLQKQTGKLKISHLHFGGGSPTALSAEDFSRIMQALKQGFAFQADAEIAIEMDPRTVDAEKIQTYASAGVNRASIGVQDFDPKVQEAIHREQSYDCVAGVIEQLRTQGINAINLDLMYGLPYQTEASVALTAKQALSLEPSRLAVFGYAHVPWMRKHQEVLSELPMANTEQRVAMFNAMRDVFESEGYVAIGIDHYAQAEDSMVKAMESGNLKRNFQGYTTDQAETVLACGISSISSLPQGYAQNTMQIKEYKKLLSESQSPVNRGRPISAADHLRREIINELMCHYRIDLSAIATRFQSDDSFTTELEALTPFIEADLLQNQNNHILQITEAGKPHVRAICAVFDQYLQQSDKKFSLAV